MRILLLCIALCPIVASAADLNAAQASKIIEGCSVHARSRSQSHVIVVVDSGGVPVFTVDGDFIGAVGVSGEAPADDAACAEAGIRAAGLASGRPKRQ